LKSAKVPKIRVVIRLTQTIKQIKYSHRRKNDTKNAKATLIVGLG